MPANRLARSAEVLESQAEGAFVHGRQPSAGAATTDTPTARSAAAAAASAVVLLLFHARHNARHRPQFGMFFVTIGVASCCAMYVKTVPASAR